MAASASDKFQIVANETATTLAANMTSGDTAITVASTAGWPTTTGVTFAIDSVTMNGTEEVQTAGTYTLYHGVVANGTTINSITLASDSPNSAQNYAAGSLTRVYMPISAEHHNLMVEGLLVSHDQTGAIKAPPAYAFSETADIALSTTYATVASKVLPSVSAAHKYLITASFAINNNGAAYQEYSLSIAEGTTDITVSYMGVPAGVYFTSPCTTTAIFTSSASGGQTINFRIKNAYNTAGKSHWSGKFTIVDLGLA